MGIKELNHARFIRALKSETSRISVLPFVREGYLYRVEWLEHYNTVIMELFIKLKHRIIKSMVDSKNVVPPKVYGLLSGMTTYHSDYIYCKNMIEVEPIVPYSEESIIELEEQVKYINKAIYSILYWYKAKEPKNMQFLSPYICRKLVRNKKYTRKEYTMIMYSLFNANSNRDYYHVLWSIPRVSYEHKDNEGFKHTCSIPIIPY